MSIIRKLREYGHLTQAELAKILNVSRTTVTMWEKEQRIPDYDTVKILSSFFSVSTDFIIGAGVFENWEEILEKKEQVFAALRERIPAGYAATGDEKNLIAKLDNMFFYDFDEIVLARWFSYAVKQVSFCDEDFPTITFTSEFLAVIADFEVRHENGGLQSATLAELHDSFIESQLHGKWIPVLGDVAAGIPIEAIEDIEDYEEIPASLAKTGEFFALKIKGNSMEPRIREGDVVIVRKQNDADTGDIAIVLVNGDSATCKRIKKEPDGSLWLIPNNPAYDSRHFSPAEIQDIPVSIIGRVVELRAKF